MHKLFTRTLTQVVISFFYFTNLVFAANLVPVDTFATDSSKVSIKIINEEGTPLEASILVETLDHRLVEKLELSAGSNFIFHFKEEVYVTAYSYGYTPVSVFVTGVGGYRIQLSRTPIDQYSVLQGQLPIGVSTFGSSDVKLGFVAKALEFSDLASFEMSSFLSPYTDSISAYAMTWQMPSNIIVPSQIVFITLAPVPIDKDSYRLPVATGKSQRYFSVSGRIPGIDVVSAFRNKNTWSLIDLLEIQKIGVSPEVLITQSSLTRNFTADRNVRQSFLYKPIFATAPANTRGISMALLEEVSPSGSIFIPTDINLTGSGNKTLKTADITKTRVLELLVTTSGDRISARLYKIQEAPAKETGLQMTLNFQNQRFPMLGRWEISAPPGYEKRTMVARIEKQAKSSIGAKKTYENWVLIQPYQRNFEVPQATLRELNLADSQSNQATLDLIDMGISGYPRMEGDKKFGLKEFKGLDRVQKQITLFR